MTGHNLSNCVLPIFEESMFKILLRRSLLVSFLLFQIKVDLSHFQLIFFISKQGKKYTFCVCVRKNQKKSKQTKTSFFKSCQWL